ncbi:MAG: molybdopterin converting factor subunit 1 [Ferrovibrio sp.]|uniref:molybdopterin converting factor subunit 1 n=1 Tax=Ferrovibrio sp. TaxID=1917215 RepID=UPI002608B4B0|nr:molybdopterin converting factor subunit 1 [Ferrovibrio sp.]MCW0236653.1 molybdopterin converting factor subunit 1 [Ferrovibrio sp.]
MRVLYFALLRERVGMAEETVALPENVRTVADLIAWLRSRSPQHEAALADPTMVRVAVNQDYAQPGDAVQPGDEVAFFPPVTGG